MTEPYKLSIKIDGLPKILTNGSQGSWRAVHFEKKKWQDLVAAHVNSRLRPPTPLNRATIICTRHSPRTSDFDNRVSSFKAVVDGLVTIGVLRNDSDDVLVLRQYRWQKCAPKLSHITVELEECV